MIIYAALHEPHRAVLALVIGPVVLAAAMAEKRFRFHIPSSMLLLGAASYAIYLIHNPIQSLVARALKGLDSWLLTFAACIVAGVVAGVCYNLIYERPALRMLSKRKYSHFDVGHIYKGDKKNG